MTAKVYFAHAHPVREELSLYTKEELIDCVIRLDSMLIAECNMNQALQDKLIALNRELGR